MDAHDKLKRSRSFESGADEYERLRPEFPAQVFDDICVAAGSRIRGRTLEVGAGTGRATLPLARRGARIEVVEPSADMLAILARRLDEEAVGDRCDLRQATFEDVDADEVYDVVIAAQSFHWADPATRWQRLSSLLRADGRAFLFWNGWHLAPTAHDVAAVEVLYADHGHGLQPDLEDHRADAAWARSEIEAEPGLSLLDARTYEWSWRLPADDYLALLTTTSQYAVAEAAIREPLLTALSEILGDNVTLAGRTSLLDVAAAEQKRPPLDAAEFCTGLVSAAPELQQLLDEHLADYDGELLLHLLLPDVLRALVRAFAHGQVDLVARALASVNDALFVGDDYVRNAIAVSFVEDFGAAPGETDDLLALWPAELRAALDR